MKKEQLLSMKKLTATPSMMKQAQSDELKKRNGRYSEGYQIGRYLRCVVQRDILKVAIFLPQHMKAGGNLPVYEVYLDKKAGSFITYDCLEKKWREAMLGNLKWPSYVHASIQDYCTEQCYYQIKKYLEVRQGGYAGIYEFQLKAREEQLKRRHKRETDPWDLELAQTRPLPKDWDRWVRKVGIMHHYIFYRYVKCGAKSGFCSYCEKEVLIQKPRHNKVGKCPRCGHRIQFKSLGKMGAFDSPTVSMYLLQRCDSGFMVRQFSGCVRYVCSDFRNPHYSCWEVRRALFDVNAHPIHAYYKGVYKQRETRWIQGNNCAPNWWGCKWENGMLYGKSLPILFKNELKETGFEVFLRQRGQTDPELYLANYNRVPQLEQLVKADLQTLVSECLKNCGVYRDYFNRSNGTSLTKALQIDGPRLKRLRESGRGLKYLIWLRQEKLESVQVDDSILFWFCDEDIKPENLKFISDRMSYQQIYNYIRRQMAENKEGSKWFINTWADYLSMANKLGMDTSDSIIYRVRKLRQRHQELVDRCNEIQDELRAKELAQQFPHVGEICNSIAPLYTYAGKDYLITVPSGILDIMLEGKHLSHCVGSSNRYLDRIERQESYVLFLRRASDPHSSYYTLEVEPDGTVRQKRTMFDRQEKNIEQATEFLREWQSVVSGRLSGKERKLAVRSKELREQEFKQLKKDNVILYTKGFYGRPLLEVLLEDLMENKENAAEPVLAAAT